MKVKYLGRSTAVLMFPTPLAILTMACASCAAATEVHGGSAQPDEADLLQSS